MVTAPRRFRPFRPGSPARVGTKSTLSWSCALALCSALTLACGGGDDTATTSPGEPVGGAGAAAGGSGGEAGGESAGQGGEAGAGAGGAVLPEPEPLACGAALPGVPLASGLVEGATGYAGKLAALDLGAVPDPFDFSGESPIVVGIVRYMLGDLEATSVSRAEAEEKGGMALAVFAAAAATKDHGASGTVDVAFLRQGLHHFYPCTEQPPQSLALLKQLVGDYTKWDSEELECGAPKDGPRRIFQDAVQGVYVAETIEDGAVRETEVIFSNRRADGQLSFAVYTPEGELTNRSTFATAGGDTIVLAAPFTCMSCHVDVDTERYDVKRPEGTGAGCRD
jgi:hypothetical protein